MFSALIGRAVTMLGEAEFDPAPVDTGLGRMIVGDRPTILILSG